MNEVDRFDCVSDEGTIYTIIEFETVSIFRPLAGQERRGRGVRSWQTTRGLGVNYIDGVSYEIVENDTIVKRV